VRATLRIVDGRLYSGYGSYQAYGSVGTGGAIGVTLIRGGQSASGSGRLSGRLALVRAREHRSEVMLSVLVVVLCRNRIAILSFSAGQRQISLIALFHVLKALRLRSE
jgi:hypothetical protein